MRTVCSSKSAMVTRDRRDGADPRARPAPARSWSRARIHQPVPRRDMPFVVVNCGALPEALLESELFGHEGRLHRRPVRREGPVRAGRRRHALPRRDRRDRLADAGQAAARAAGRRSRARRRQRGRSRSTSASIAATNRDLETRSTQGEFREDLYYRLNVIAIPCRRCASGRGHPAARRSTSSTRFAPRMNRRVAGHLPAGDGPARALRLAGQRARAAEPIERAVVVNGKKAARRSAPALLPLAAPAEKGHPPATAARWPNRRQGKSLHRERPGAEHVLEHSPCSAEVLPDRPGHPLQQDPEIRPQHKAAVDPRDYHLKSRT